MQNERIYLAAAEAAGARGEPGNGISPSVALSGGPTDRCTTFWWEWPCL